MANRLLGRLREKNKKSGLFNKTSTHVSYPTGFLNFDFTNGYILQSRDGNDELIGEFPNIGITGGSFNTVIGRSGSAKTTATVQWSAEIVRPFENGFVMHIDLEQSTHYTRIKNLTGYTNQELQDKYVLKQEKCYMEDIFDMIMEVVNEKETHKEDYMYEAPFTNEFGEKIKLYVPTVFIIDSIPGMSSRPETKKDKETGVTIEVREMETSTAAMRNAKNLKNFYIQLMPLVKQYNIIIFMINHINSNISINPFEKKQPQLLYLKMDESLPGGSAPIKNQGRI
jgi:RecA/RadA recombinase